MSLTCMSPNSLLIAKGAFRHAFFTHVCLDPPFWSSQKHTHTHTHFNYMYTKMQIEECMVLTGTHCSCISWVGAGTSKVGAALATFCQVTLCPCTIHTVIPGWTTSSSKDSISRSFNCSWVAQLTAHNCSVKKVPVVITHSSPLAKEKNLNTTFQQSITSHQSNSPFWSCVIWRDIYMGICTYAQTEVMQSNCEFS